MLRYLCSCCLFTLFVFGCSNSDSNSLYRMCPDHQSRWASFENPLGEKGAGAKENRGAKGHPYEFFAAGETKTLCDVQGAGIIQRIWITLSERDPVMLRALRIDMYWDGMDTPAVSAPFGDFFGSPLGHLEGFENALFSNPEGRSFNCIVPMPFRTGAKITLTNEGEKDIRLFFYDVEYNLVDALADDALYFHAWWHRENLTTLGKDFEILPAVEGQGRFLGCHYGIQTPLEDKGWWGEGEVKVYLDGDGEYPTIVGTGTEDYIGTGWGQGEYTHQYQGCWLADKDNGRHTFYRYHIPAPIWFHDGVRVTIQQMGGEFSKIVLGMLESGLDIQPVTLGVVGKPLDHLLERDFDWRSEELPDGWLNYYRRDDVCATVFFYLDRPVSGLPALQSVEERVADLRQPETK